METVKANIQCPITNTYDANIVCNKDRNGNALRTVVNTLSGLVYTDPRPEHKQVKEFYSENYRTEYKGSYIPKRKHIYRAGKVALKRWKRIEKFLSGQSRILDAGSGGGELMYLLNKKGFSVKGIEPNKGYAEFARKSYGLDIDVSFFEDTKLEINSFDTIVLFHVLEHLESPVQELKNLTKLLDYGGLIIIEVPNVMYTEGYPTSKWHLGHLYNFNLTTLNAIAIKSGLSLVFEREVDDGGNIMGVFKKMDALEEINVKGNYEKTVEVLKSHTLQKHFLSPNPYVRPIFRFLNNLEEFLAVKTRSTAREILDSLY